MTETENKLNQIGIPPFILEPVTGVIFWTPDVAEKFFSSVEINEVFNGEFSGKEIKLIEILHNDEVIGAYSEINGTGGFGTALNSKELKSQLGIS